ncbi:MAG: hypothetical protein Q4A32_05590 [Lachnospiraceae bacterium]|nr:hypothetical protein [Lachnospiraceae bacterium]
MARRYKYEEQVVSTVAEKKLTYKELLQERDAYKAENDALKRNRVNRQAKNSVFLNLFMRKEYQLKLYKDLFPADTTITEDDLELVTLDNVLTIHPYNDLGLLARGRLIVLAEAQSTKSMNIIFRLADYYFDSAMSYLVMRNVDLYSSVKIDIPDVEAFVIYTGKKKVEKDVLSLNQVFFGGNPDKPEFKARIIHGDYKGGIIEEYMGFCRIWDEHVLAAKTPEQKQEAVAITIDLCIQRGYLAEYLQAHRGEVEKIMMTMLSPEYVKMASERTEKIKEAIAFGRDAGMGEDQIKSVIIKRYDLTPTYAQNFLDDNSDPEDSRPWAL